MNATDPAVLEAIRTEYVTGADRPTMRQLAERYGIGFKTIARASTSEGWRALRSSHWLQVAKAVVSQGIATAAVAAEAEEDSREKSAEILRYVRDGLTKALQEGLRRLVTAKGMDPQEAAKVVARWEEMAGKDLTRFLAQGPQALASIVKTLELVEGRPTERHEFQLPTVPMTAEEEATIDRIWDQVRVHADSG